MASVTEKRTFGAQVLERLSSVSGGIPAAVKPQMTVFAKRHGAYEAAAIAADEAEAARDAVLEQLNAVDEQFDGDLHLLADKMVGAGLGSRAQPFNGFSKYSPSKLAGLPYAKEPAAARELAVAIQKKKPPAEVSKWVTKCLKHVESIEGALKQLAVVQAEYKKALGAREALVEDWSKALGKLKKAASLAWDDEPATYRAMFGEPSRIHAPKAKRAVKKKVATG